MLEYLEEQYHKDPKDREQWVHPGLGEVVLIAHTCHPKQANDGLSGVVVAKMLSAYPSIACPEGESQHRIKELSVKYAIYLDALGGNNKLKCNATLRGDTPLDKAATYVFGQLYPSCHLGLRNDELRLEDAGYPCLAIHRFPFDEYHTPEDTPKIVRKESLIHAFWCIGNIMKLMYANYVPKRGKNWGDAFTGLSKYGLWTDWQHNLPSKNFKELVLAEIDENQSILDIAVKLREGFWAVYHWVGALRRAEICVK